MLVTGKSVTILQNLFYTVQVASQCLQQQEVGMDGPLLDQEQFPRSDIDLVIVRSARNRIICKQHVCCSNILVNVLSCYDSSVVEQRRIL